MLNRTQIKDAKRAAGYFGKSDSGYYLKDGDMRREWGGKVMGMLGMTGLPTHQQLHRLLHGFHPLNGKPLTAMLADGRTPGWDFTASAPKGVTTALEGGDTRIERIMWRAATEAMAEVEQYATTRERIGGRDADRLTGNWGWLAVEHPDTRPTVEDGMPDWDRHFHFIVANATFDKVESRMKALKVERIFELRKYFSHAFDLRLSTYIADAGYAIETKLQPDDHGGMKYFTWDIKAAPGHETGWQSINAKNSRRTVEIGDKEAEIVAGIKQHDADAPDRLSKRASSKLAKTTRREKRKDLTIADLREYWASRIMPEERLAIDETIRRAMAGENARPENKAAQAMEYAMAHHFQRNSVVDFHDLAATAMERCMGAALPEDFRAEAVRLGMLSGADGVTTRKVLAQEQKIIGFARAGKGTFAPLAPGKEDGLAGLSDEQAAAVRHAWNSTDQLMLIRGGAGTGKTTMMTPALARIGVPVVLLAPSAEASRGQLRKEGFGEADTVAAFLGDEKRQEQVAGGGIIWVDEAGLLAIDDLERLCEVAAAHKARIVLQGDPRQHKAVDRHGNMLEVLEGYAGLPVARLTQIQRQKGDYAGAVAAIRDGELAKADGILRKLGWIVEGSGHEALVAEYAKAIEETKPNGDKKTVLVIDPTHKDGDILTEALRAVRREKGLITGEEKPFQRLVALGWTDAQKSDGQRYTGEEVIQFYRNSGKFKAGDRVQASELLPHLARVKPKNFAVFREEQVNFAVGDTVRITGNGWDVSKKHRIDNGRIDEIRAITADGDLVLANGWQVGKAFGHFKHGLVSTSPATQSKTDDIVLAAMNKNSLGAMGAEQGYVTISRGRERGMIFTDMPRDELLAAIARADSRRSATELLQPRRRQTMDSEEGRRWRFLEKVRTAYRQLQRKAVGLVVKEPIRQKELGYGR